jgi:protein-disulfide isomerase-like protein with CxxC motif
MSIISVTHFSDPGCPWAWSESPALAVLRWRYGDQLAWRHVMIGLSESGDSYARRGYTAERMAQGYRRFRERGMPFATAPRERPHGTWPACRVIVATRLLFPLREWAVFRALQFAQFTSTLSFERPEDLRAAIDVVADLDADAVMAAAESPETEAAFAADRAEARRADGSPTQFQGRAAVTPEGEVRYTAPSLVFTADDGRRLEAGGFQPLEAYDVLIANLDPTLERREPAAEPGEVLTAFPDGLTTAEVAAVMTPNNVTPDLGVAEDALIALVAADRAEQRAFGDGALWLASDLLVEEAGASGARSSLPLGWAKT